MTIKSEKDTTEKDTTEKNTVKVSTGAWWKRAPAKDNDLESDSSKAEKKSATQKSGKKKTGKAASAKAEPSIEEAGGKAAKKKSGKSAEPAIEDEKEGAAAKKKPSRRSRSSRTSAASKRRSSSAEETSREASETVETDERKETGTAERSPKEGKKSPEADDKVLSSDEEKEGGEQERVEPVKKKKSRGRRGRKSAQEKSAKAGDAAGGSPAADGQEEQQEDHKKSGEQQREELPKKPLKLLINAEEPEECRLALLEDGRLESIHVSTVSREQRKNNIYKARVVAIEPSLQAAFVDYGTEKNGFLPFGEIHPEYFKSNLSDKVKELVEKQQWKKLSITDVLEKGQELLAQVVKEEVGKKGANMTTFLSLPGRCVVLMPGSDSAGISRKISGEQRRSQLREIMRGLVIPEGVGWIVRTASVDITENALSRDVDYLTKLWAEIRQRGQDMRGVGLLYEDHQTVSRFLREHFDPAIEEILVDDRPALEQVKEFVAMLPKSQQAVRVRLHQGARPIFNQYSVEDQIESIYQPQVNLPSGGSIVISPTEALVAVDVNSGSTSKGADFEESIFQANLEAATELARQLRLRDLGGLIVVDFIDMRSRKHIIAVEKQMKQAMKRDRAKVDFSRISKFGLLQISRQKLGAPIEAGNYRICEYCKGRGTIRSVETLSLFYLRRIQTGASRKPVERIECHFPMDVASYLLNHKRVELNEMEKRYQVEISITARARMKPADNEIVFHKKEKNSQEKEGK